MDQVKQMMKNLRSRVSKINIRKFTNNERILATLLAIILSFWLSYKFIIKPQLKELSSLKSDIDSYSDQIVKNNELIKNSASISDSSNTLTMEKKSMERVFFKNLNQAEIIYELDRLLSKSKLNIGDINFGRPFTEIVDEKEIGKMEISMPYEGNFASLDKTIKILEDEDRKIIISSVDILKGEETDISGNMNLEIYGLLLDEEELEEESSVKAVDNNKSNPFVPYKGYVDPVKEKERLDAIAKAKAEAEAKAKEAAEKEKDKSEEKPKEEDKEKDKEKEAEKDKEKEEAKEPEQFDIYVAVKGDNISYISRRKYGSERYVDEILRLNDMVRSSILPIGKKLKLRRR